MSQVIHALTGPDRRQEVAGGEASAAPDQPGERPQDVRGDDIKVKGNPDGDDDRDRHHRAQRVRGENG